MDTSRPGIFQSPRRIHAVVSKATLPRVRWRGEVTVIQGLRPAKLDENESRPLRVFHGLAHVFDPVARLLPERQRFQDGLLLGDERLHSLAGVSDHLRQLLLVEDLVFSSRLDFDELIAGGHDEVHIDVGAGVLFVAEVEQYFPVDNSDANRGHKILERNRRERSRVHQLFQRQAQRDESARDRRGARASVGLDDVAVDPDRALAEARRDRLRRAENGR